ncbi:MAG: hypothetical protein K6F52_04485 [Clostridia bacterium]|nr:hypothetical protein [Clostridia bacterium]
MQRIRLAVNCKRLVCTLWVTLLTFVLASTSISFADALTFNTSCNGDETITNCYKETKAGSIEENIDILDSIGIDKECLTSVDSKNAVLNFEFSSNEESKVANEIEIVDNSSNCRDYIVKEGYKQDEIMLNDEGLFLNGKMISNKITLLGTLSSVCAGIATSVLQDNLFPDSKVLSAKKEIYYRKDRKNF